MSPEECIKLVNTHAGGCFVSDLYPRFCISPPPSADDDTIDDDCDDDDSDTTEGSSTTDDDGSDDDESGSTDAGDSSDDCDDGMLSTIDANDNIDCDDVGIIEGPKGGNDNSRNAATAVRTSASSRRVFNTPHPDVGVSLPTATAAVSDKKKKKKPSKLESLIAEMNNVEHCNNNATKPPHKHQILPRRRFYPSEARLR